MTVSTNNVLHNKEYVYSDGESSKIISSYGWDGLNLASSTTNDEQFSLLSKENTFSISGSIIKPIVSSSTTTISFPFDKSWKSLNVPNISVLKETGNLRLNENSRLNAINFNSNIILSLNNNLSEEDKYISQILDNTILLKENSTEKKLDIFASSDGITNYHKKDYNTPTLFTTPHQQSTTFTPHKEKSSININTTSDINKFNNSSTNITQENINTEEKSSSNIQSKKLVPIPNAPHIVVSEEALQEEVYSPNCCSALWEMCFCCCCEPYRFVLAMTAFETFFSIYWFFNQVGIVIKGYSHSQALNITILVLLTGMVIIQVIGFATAICAKVKGEARFLYPRIIIQTAFCCLSMLSFLILLLYFTGSTDSINKWLTSKYMNIADDQMDVESRQEFESDLRTYIIVLFFCSAISVIYYFFGLNMAMKWKRSLLEHAASRAYVTSIDTGGYVPVAQEPSAPPPPTNPNFPE
uniref:MARVEL domain-containing protein n=1 Tax=Parastrongyloides trichosuri TaxID=131310 RepID=A0A0N4ZHL6_PARTI